MGLHKAPIERSFIHTYANFSLFSYRYGGCYTRGALQSPFREGFCEAPFVEGVLWTPLEALHRGFAKLL